MSLFERFTPAQAVQAAALIAALAGVATWSSLLLTSAESGTPVATPSWPAERSSNPALQWFSNQPAQVDIKVSGVLVGSRGAVAILSLGDSPPRSVLVGEPLSHGVKVAAIEGDSVVIERGGERTRLLLDKLPQAPALPRLTRP